MRGEETEGEAHEANRDTITFGFGSMDHSIEEVFPVKNRVRGRHARVDSETTMFDNLPVDLSGEKATPKGRSDSTTILSSAMSSIGASEENPSAPEVNFSEAAHRAVVIDSKIADVKPETGSGEKHLADSEFVFRPLREDSAELDREFESALAPTKIPKHVRQKKQRVEVRPTVAPEAKKVDEREYWLRRRTTDEKIRVQGNRFVVGKSKYSSFQVRNTTTVSRSHAIFAVDEEGCWVEDDDSRNGTFVDNRRIIPHVRERLSDGMVIRMSDEEFEFSEIVGGQGETR